MFTNTITSFDMYVYMIEVFTCMDIYVHLLWDIHDIHMYGTYIYGVVTSTIRVFRYLRSPAIQGAAARQKRQLAKLLAGLKSSREIVVIHMILH